MVSARVRSVYAHPLFAAALASIQERERERKFCRHGLPHLLDTARIMCILGAKEGYAADEIYACALLHDLGRAEEGEHAQKSAELAAKILPECGFSAEESGRICTAIAAHGHEKEGEGLAGLLSRADRLSRACYACPAAEECYWTEKNKGIEI